MIIVIVYESYTSPGMASSHLSSFASFCNSITRAAKYHSILPKILSLLQIVHMSKLTCSYFIWLYQVPVTVKQKPHWKQSLSYHVFDFDIETLLMYLFWQTFVSSSYGEHRKQTEIRHLNDIFQSSILNSMQLQHTIGPQDIHRMITRMQLSRERFIVLLLSLWWSVCKIKNTFLWMRKQSLLQ